MKNLLFTDQTQCERESALARAHGPREVDVVFLVSPREVETAATAKGYDTMTAA